MKSSLKFLSMIAIAGVVILSSCSDDDDALPTVVYQQEDQMARPGINTVFIAAGTPKDNFNVTIPSAMGSIYTPVFSAVLTSFGYTANALGHDKATFSGILATDVLNVSLTGKTTFFDGTNVLTGRALADDVIDTELLLIFGGPAGTSNPGLTSDKVGANDKAFLTTFPYLAAPF
jgi:hypothetical protein